MKLPYNNLFFHICQVHFKNPLFFSWMFLTFNTGRSCNLSWGTKFMHIKTKTLHLSTKLFREFIKLVKTIYERKVEVNKQQWKQFESFQQAWNNKLCNQWNSCQGMREWTCCTMQNYTIWWSFNFDNFSNLTAWKFQHSWMELMKLLTTITNI